MIATRRVAPALVGATVLAVLLTSMVVALGIGSVQLPVADVAAVVVRRLGLGDHGVTLAQDQIVWQLRLPRVLGVVAIGAGLACAGAVLQSLTRNDLADPFLLGISSGAAVGAVTVIVLGVSFAGLVGSAAVTFSAFVGALGALVLVLAIATARGGDLPPARTVLAGVAVGYIGSSYASLLTIMEGDDHAAKRVLAWTLGSAAGLRWGSAVFLAIVALLALLVFVLLGPHLDAFAFGEDAARALGIRVERLRWLLFVVTALMTAAMVAFAGAIGFVGLVVPHIVRGVVGPGHRALLPLAALVGAALLLWADTLARSVVTGQEIPLGVVTAVIGTPFFVWLLRRRREAM